MRRSSSPRRAVATTRVRCCASWKPYCPAPPVSGGWLVSRTARFRQPFRSAQSWLERTREVPQCRAVNRIFAGLRTRGADAARHRCACGAQSQPTAEAQAEFLANPSRSPLAGVPPLSPLPAPPAGRPLSLPGRRPRCRNGSTTVTTPRITIRCLRDRPTRQWC